jgi:hypothetical protein
MLIARHAIKPASQAVAVVPVVSLARARQEAKPISKSPATINMIQFIGLF